MRRFHPKFFLIFIAAIWCNVCFASPSPSYSSRYISESDSMFSRQTTERAKATNVLVAITVHFDSSRMQYLANVLSCLSTFPKADIVLVTNTFKKRELLALQKVCEERIPGGIGGGSVSIRSYGNLSHPYNLTWCHKDIIRNEFIVNNSIYSHFIYLEDDIGFDFANFCYFLEFREILRGVGLLPSFLRVEYNEKQQDFCNTDHYYPIHVLDRPNLSEGAFLLVNPPNPYMACFVLDTELAKEYVQTPFFQEETCDIPGWGVRERAAAGLCFANIPPAFQSRYVVPVFSHIGIAPYWIWISHFPNNYANHPTYLSGKTPMNKLFVLP